MTETQAIRKKLEAAQRAIDAALSLLPLEIAEAPETFSAKRCMWCGKPLEKGSDTTRELHTNPCYHQWYAENIKSGKYASVDEAEAVGAIPPKGKPGRKRKDYSENQARMRQQLESEARQRKSRKKKDNGGNAN